ncbi:MAG: MATE family efflux transporter [Lachnospiraceae bacterium]|nr:MATE family efflux transporter [Lachnospiraceae bacterium]
MKKNSFLSRFIGDKAFYKKILIVAIPMVIQNLITNFVSLLDNIMVGQVGTEQMSGVAIANQLIFVFTLVIFGSLSGVGIFTAQFFGAGDEAGARATVRMKIVVGVIILGIFYLVAFLWGRELISLFLTGDDAPEKVAITLSEGMRYLRIMFIGLPPFVASQVYGSSLKEFGETRLPMQSGIIAVFVNLVGNYVFIFGHFGAPAMGVAGAALATVISRYVEAGIMMWETHRHVDRFTFMSGLFKHEKMPSGLVMDVIRKGVPLTINEFLWSAGMAAISQSYSTRGLSAVAAVNINSTVTSLFSIMFFSFGTVISIFVGQALGSGDMEEARITDSRIMTFSLSVSAVTGLVSFVLSPLFPQLYNVTDEVKELAIQLLRIASLCMPIGALVHSCYFTLRTGGKTLITFLFDSVFLCLVAYPTSFILSRFTDMPLKSMFLCINLLDLIKIAIGLILVGKGVWLNNLVEDKSTKSPETQN